MTPIFLALLVAFVGVPLNWYVTWRLWRLWHRLRNPVVRERAIVSLVLSIVVTIFALIFLNNDALPPPLSGEVTKWVTRFALLVASVVPSAYWLWLYR